MATVNISVGISHSGAFSRLGLRLLTVLLTLMGLDLLLGAINQQGPDAGPSTNEYWLSRRFCNLMLQRDNGSAVTPALEQIGRIIDVDVQPLYEMLHYPQPEDVESVHEMVDEQEKQLILEQMEATRAAVQGNIDRVTGTIEALLNKLTQAQGWQSQLVFDAFDQGRYDWYFADFAQDTGDGNNNFGQDLRNFRRFLSYAKSRDSESVFFVLG